MEISSGSVHRIEEAVRRQKEMCNRIEQSRRMAEIRKEAVKCWGQKISSGMVTEGRIAALWKRGMDILRKRRTDIMKGKEEQDEHTVQKGSIGAMRIVSAH
ncbi:MAG: hypothetical protein NC389_05080 [Acetatifactor muris]|nr:hypothetical protein [Acetatifactor muris]